MTVGIELKVVAVAVVVVSAGGLISCNMEASLVVTLRTVTMINSTKNNRNNKIPRRRRPP